MEEQKWASGIVKTINSEHETGIIEQFDGLEVLFTFTDLEIKSYLTVGQKVLYSVEKDTYLGLTAKHITPLDEMTKS